MPIIRDPGKFEGEHTLTQKLWTKVLNGEAADECFDSATGNWLARVRLPGGSYAVLSETNSGFVWGLYGDEAVIVWEGTGRTMELADDFGV